MSDISPSGRAEFTQVHDSLSRDLARIEGALAGADAGRAAQLYERALRVRRIVRKLDNRRRVLHAPD